MEKKKISLELIIFCVAVIPGVAICIYNPKLALLLVKGATFVIGVMAWLGGMIARKIRATVDAMPVGHRNMRGLLDRTIAPENSSALRPVIGACIGIAMLMVGLSAGMIATQFIRFSKIF